MRTAIVQGRLPRARAGVPLCFLICLWWLWPAPAQAQSCNLTPAAMSFGSIYTAGNQPYFATSDLQLSCFGDPNRTIRICTGIGPGEIPAGVDGPRRLGLNESRLDFDFFTSSAHTTRYPNGIQSVTNPTTYTVPPGGSGIKVVTVYGRIPAQGGVASGAYSGYFEVNMRYGYSATYTSCADTNYSLASYGIQVSATNESGCTASTAPVAFGTAVSLNAAVDAQGAINMICPPNTTYAIKLGGGANGGTNPTDRKMANGSDRITYGLFRDAARTQGWFTDADNDLNGTSSNSYASQSIPIYGRVPAQATPPQGSYADTVIVTITY